MINKRFLSIVLTIIIALSSVFSLTTVYAGGVNIELFGEPLIMPDEYGKAFIDAATSRTLVPARGVFEAVNASVEWVGAERTVYVEKDGIEIKVIIDSTTAYKNGAPITLDQPAKIVDDRTYVPLRFIAESIELDVDFDESTTTVKINNLKKNADKFEKGIYKVGTDISAAEYLFIADAGAKEGGIKVKLLRNKESSKAENIISTIDFKNSIYINLLGSQYTEIIGCTAYSLDALPDRATSGTYKNGMFKAGKEIKAGTYSVSSVDANKTSSYKIYSTPFSTAGNNIALSEGFATVKKSITLKSGQYIVLDNAKMVLTKEATTPAPSVSGGGSGGSGGSGGGGGTTKPTATPAPTAVPTTAPTLAPGATATPKPTATPVPTATPKPTTAPTLAPGATATPKPAATPTPRPTAVPTLAPSATATPKPTATPTPTPVPTATPVPTPEVSTSQKYDGYENAVYDFGYYYQLPIDAESEVSGIRIYKYDITDTDLISGNTFNRRTLRDGYVAQFTSNGFATNSRIGQDPNSFYLYSAEKGLWVEVISPTYFHQSSQNPSLEDPGVYYMTIRIFYGGIE